MANFPFSGSGVALVGGGGGSSALAISQPDIVCFLASEIYTVPESGMYRIMAIGAGGNGGGSYGGGGGAGGLAMLKKVQLTQGQEVTITIGASPGGTTTVDCLAAGVALIANGGANGQAGSSGVAGLGGAGGTASGGDWNGTGGSGGLGSSSTTSVKGGGGGVNFYGRPTDGSDAVDATAGAGGGVGSSAVGDVSGGALMAGDMTFADSGTVFNPAGLGAYSVYRVAGMGGGGGGR